MSEKWSRIVVSATYSTRWRANEHVLVRVVCDWIYKTLHTVQGLVTAEGSLAKTIHFSDLDQFLTGHEGSDPRSGDRVLFVFLIGSA